MQSRPHTPDELQIEFERLRPDYVRFTDKLKTLLGDLLAAKSLNYHLIEGRTKDVKSFREKISRSSKTYTNPLAELTDLSGLRVITYYQDDADAIGALIEKEFHVDGQNSVTYSSALAEFGYRSAHYVVRLSDERTQLLEWAGLNGLKAEIQVRTVLQHAWAAISHKLQYKREEDVPAQLRRKLFRLSALFELADDEFVSLRDASGVLTKAIDTKLARGERDILVDYMSLSQFIERSPVIEVISKAAAEVGFNFSPVDGPDDSDSDSLSDLIQLMTVVGLRTIGQIEDVFKGSVRWAMEYLRFQYVRHSDSDSSEWFVTRAFVCELILICAEVTHFRLPHLLSIGWDRGIASRVLKRAQEFKTRRELGEVP